MGPGPNVSLASDVELYLETLVYLHRLARHSCAEVPAKVIQSVSFAAAGVPEPSKSNASRFAWRAFNRCGYGWKVPLRTMHFATGQGDEILDIDYASPLDTMHYLLNNCPSVVVGGILDRPERSRHLQAFWELYRSVHPNHPVYSEHGGHLHAVIPVCYHGDEGRGKRRGNTLCISFESCIGIYTSWNMNQGHKYCSNCHVSQGVESKFPARSSSEPTARLESFVALQATNMKGHSMLQHWPIYILPGTMYKTYRPLLQECMKIVSQDFRQGFFEGVEVSGQGTVFFACIGGKGDLKWFARAADMTRSFEHLGRVQNLLMCHECEAGSDQLSWEDVGTDDPCWQDTCHQTRPWASAPPLASIPHDMAAPERQLKRDVFHLCKVGIYRDYCASSILLLLAWGYFGTTGDVDEKLERAYNHFDLWCKATQHNQAVRSFNKRFFNYPNLSSFGWTSSKGSDTMLLCKWVIVLTIGCKNSLISQDHVGVLDLIHLTGKAACDFFLSDV